ncbi:MAG: hypothetical protein IPI66_11685 [Chitinophagaceae bacterium]|nr:hypothetical protein [Chitinophagaceae bacterium]MBL0056191.1 hypothetical protein [Chitinophagaceae bacterium]
MKILFTLLAVITFSSAAQAQNDTTLPYLKNRQLPAFNLLSIDSVVFTQKNLAAEKHTILMMFNPDCDHCQKQLDSLLVIPEVVRKTQLVMISMVPLKYNREFYQKNHLEKYPFIYLGQDYEGLCLRFFKPHTVPVLAFYDRKRQFVNIHQGNAERNLILEALQH